MYLLLFLLPLGLDTLGVSISLGISSSRSELVRAEERNRSVPVWLSSAILFSLAETTMPLVGLAIGYATSLVISGVIHFVGPFLLIAVGLWELVEEALERLAKRKRKEQVSGLPQVALIKINQTDKQSRWRGQLLLALSVSLDELAIGFSLGSVATGKSLSPFTLCIFIGLQGFLMAVIGITLGHILRTRLKLVKEWSELLSGLLLIGLGAWLLIT
jgi:manganese efflux pump family protein